MKSMAVRVSGGPSYRRQYPELSETPQQNHRWIHSLQRSTDTVIHAKGALTKV